MIAPYDPHGCSAVVGRVDKQSGKRSKGMTIIPLDPSGFFAADGGWGVGRFFWPLSVGWGGGSDGDRKIVREFRGSG